MGGSPGDVGEVPTDGLERLCLILQHLHPFTYVTAHSPTLPPLYLRHSSFYSPSVASPTSYALHRRHSSFSKPFHHFIYATAHSTTLPPLQLRHRSFYNPSIASPTSQALHVFHLAHAQRDEKTVCGGLACCSKLLSLEVTTVLDRC